MTTRACATCRENVRLIDTLTNAAWDAVTAAPGMRRLYPGYWVAMRTVIRDRMCHHGAGAPSADARAFAASLARDVLARLEEILRGTPHLDRVARTVPAALTDVLEAAAGRLAAVSRTRQSSKTGMILRMLTMAILVVVGSGLARTATAAPATGAQATWTKSCKSCHGEDGRGNPKMAKALKVEPAVLDLTRELTVKKKDAALADVVATGLVDGKKTKMPAYGKKLKPAEIQDLVALIRGFCKAK